MRKVERLHSWQKAKGHKIYGEGDKIRVYVPGRKRSVQGVFRAHVIPDGAPEYLEVFDHENRLRCLYLDAVK